MTQREGMAVGRTAVGRIGTVGGIRVNPLRNNEWEAPGESVREERQGVGKCARTVLMCPQQWKRWGELDNGEWELK